MLLLITDTSGKHGSVALARAGEGADPNKIEVIQEVPLAGGTFSAQLVPQIADLLNQHGLSKAEIGAFIVVAGPGSFTGLRVGLAAIKALAEILHKPIVPLSRLEVVAFASRTHGKIAAALDAGRGEVYAGEYELASDSARVIREQLLPRNEFLSMAGMSPIATPDEALAALARTQGISVISIATASVVTIAELGWRKLRAGETVSPEQLEANYIRRSDAEFFAKSGP